mmetsp:Transcript_20697/g.44436  ORF Transcript_20697/g.44436 Transcript_20697/m.44436 type:complete len:296 (-) Transcript_20697:608-1495(-)
MRISRCRLRLLRHPLCPRPRRHRLQLRHQALECRRQNAHQPSQADHLLPLLQRPRRNPPHQRCQGALMLRLSRLRLRARPDEIQGEEEQPPPRVRHAGLRQLDRRHHPRPKRAAAHIHPRLRARRRRPRRRARGTAAQEEGGHCTRRAGSLCLQRAHLRAGDPLLALRHRHRAGWARRVHRAGCRRHATRRARGGLLQHPAHRRLLPLPALPGAALPRAETASPVRVPRPDHERRLTHAQRLAGRFDLRRQRRLRVAGRHQGRVPRRGARSLPEEIRRLIEPSCTPERRAASRSA